MEIVDLDIMSHSDAEERQMARLKEVQDGGEDTLFIVRHPEVITLGKGGGHEHLLAAEEYFTSRGVEIRSIARGGNITCHFPGQLVAYPIFRLDKRPGGIRRFFHDLEEAVIRTAARFGVEAHRRENHPGVWIQERKLCSIGIGVRRWVSFHGLALNVEPDLSLFEMITPCGIAGATPTSLSREAGRDIKVDEVKNVLTEEIKTIAHSTLAAQKAS